jgi:uncharacterized membrane protein YeaQ/YmgE (transglycosylase-associated protein family)
MALWTLIVWLVIGAAAGVVGRKVIGGTPPFGMVGDLILGIAGGVVGGYGLALVGASGPGGVIGSFVTALLGAVVLLWLGNLVKRS